MMRTQVFGVYLEKYYLASYMPGQQAVAARWLKEIAHYTFIIG
jgi:hypothetical protein